MIRTLRDIRVAGAAVAANTKLSLDAAVEAELVAQGVATHVVQLGPASGEVQSVGPLRIVNPRGLRRWRRALADALSSPPRISVIGDSVVAGIGSDGNNNASQADSTADPLSWPGQLRKLFARGFAGNEMGWIHAGDSRNILGGSCVISNTTGFLGTAVATTQGALRIASGDSITRALPKCTDIDIYYYESNGANATPTTGAFTYNIDAAGAVQVANAGGDNILKKVTVSGLSDATHSLVLEGVNATEAYVGGIIYYTSAGPGVVVSRFGLGSATSADILGLGGTSGAVVSTNSFGQARMLQSLSIVSPNLAVIACGHNDCSQQEASKMGTTPAIYQRNVATMIDALVSAGACVLLISEPDSPTRKPVAGGFDVRDYWPAAEALATQGSHVAYAKCYDVLGDWATANAALLHTQAASTVHLSRMGYGDIARALYSALTSPAAGEIPVA